MASVSGRSGGVAPPDADVLDRGRDAPNGFPAWGGNATPTASVRSVVARQSGNWMYERTDSTPGTARASATNSSICSTLLATPTRMTWPE